MWDVLLKVNETSRMGGVPIVGSWITKVTESVVIEMNDAWLGETRGSEEEEEEEEECGMMKITI